MKIIGTKPESLVEWPSYLSYVIFLGDCNFCCGFCYVPHLVFSGKTSLDEEEILRDIDRRKDFIDAVCITGGEPTVNDELYDFLKNIKKLNLKIRIETNGSNPELIEKLIQDKLVDSIALDIKNSKEKYQETICSDINLFNISRTISLIKDSEIDYEFRTTLVPGLHTEEDILDIAEWLYDFKKVKLYVLNQFRADLPNEETINTEFIKKGNYPEEELQKIRDKLEKLGYFEKIEVRGSNV